MKTGKKSTKFDYRYHRKILKESGIVNWDLRKAPTDYQKRKIRQMVKGDEAAVYRMAKNRHDFKVKKHFIDTVNKFSEHGGIELHGRISREQVQMEYRNLIDKYKDGAISDSQMKRIRGEYQALSSALKSISTSYGRYNFTRKKVNKEEKEILLAEGWTIKGNYAYLPTNAKYSMSFIGVSVYEFNDKISHPATVEHIKNSPFKHPYRYYLIGSGRELSRLLKRLEKAGIDNLYPDLMFTSPSRSKNAINSLFPSIQQLLNYMSSILENEENEDLPANAKSEILDELIGGINILSFQKPRKQK